MDVLEEAGMLVRWARWGLALARHDTRAPSPVPDNPKFMTPRAAVELIRDGAVVAVSGLGTHQRASILYWALRESFATTRHPRRLTIVNVGGHGSRGLLPGTLDELAQPGLCTRFITSHFETFRGLLALAAAGKCELQCIPLGVLAQLYDAQRRGRNSLLATAGLGTFLDPRCGRGTPVRGSREQLVSVAGRQLRYHMPSIDVALFNAPAADRHGNVYVKNCATIGDSYEIAHAAAHNRGIVIANVGKLVDEGYDRVFLPAKMIDAVVYYPDTEQTAGFFHRDPWPAITLGGAAPIADALEHARLVRWFGEVAGGLSRRSAVDEAVYRLAATTLACNVPKGAQVALGAGHPEEIGRIVFEAGRLNELTFLVESGVVGGLPAPGAYFGAAFAPREIVSTVELFRRCARRLDAVCLGALEVDGAGNVNVSRRGPGVANYAGPGGFMDFAEAAHTVIFVLGWMRGGAIAIEDGRVRVRERGAPKFVRRVSEVTFNAARALAAGKRVFYVTPVGIFRLTQRGVELSSIMPGIDVRTDIIEPIRMRVVLPAGKIATVSQAIVTGHGFSLPALRRAGQRRTQLITHRSRRS